MTMAGDHLDGNAIGGLLAQILVAEPTAAERVCQSCRSRQAVGAHRAYPAAGVVLRCPRCGDVAVRVVERPGDRVVEFRGTWILAAGGPVDAPMIIERTTPRINALGQPIGPALSSWEPPPRPDDSSLRGRWSQVVRLDPERHAAGLFRAFAADTEHRIWTYLPWGPFDRAADFESVARVAAASADPLFFTILDPADAAPVGLVAYLRIDPPAGSIEIGGITFAPRLQRTRVATESIYLLADRAFALGYRRLEWKCDALNRASIRAAERYGFVAEGVFRQATIYKGRSRDTAWFAIIDEDWPRLRAAYEEWLDPSNFDDRGVQHRRLSDLTRAARAAPVA